MKVRVPGMPTLIYERLICLFGGENAHKHITLMVFAKMTANTALTVMNRLHYLPPWSIDSVILDRVAFGAVYIPPRNWFVSWVESAGRRANVVFLI
jgi:hypothetical protein